MTLDELIGHRLVFGIPGTQATPDILQHFRDTHAVGLILYRINFESGEQMRRLIASLEESLGRRLLVCVDHEGGRVVMFGEQTTIFPSAQAFGATNNTQLVRHQGEQEARELRRLGVDVNFAPVIDVLTDEYSPNIGIRAYGKDPDLVARMGAARISALQVEGISAVAKHFPGLGPANLDPHLDLPSIRMTWSDWERTHGVPFMRAMRTAVQGIMTSHPLYPDLDPAPATPATFSRKIVYEHLRQRIGYKGVIFSDDLEMGAVRKLAPIKEAAVLTANAGHDMILVCHDLSAQREAVEGLREAYTSGRLSKKELEESVARVQALINRRSERFAAAPATALRVAKETEEAQALVRQVCDASVTVLKPGPFPLPGRRTVVYFPRLSALAPKILIERALQNETEFLRGHLITFGVEADVRLYDIAPGAASPIATGSRPEGSSSDLNTEGLQDAQTIAFIFDAHLDAASRMVLERTQAPGAPLTVVLMRDVYDQQFVQAGAACVTNYGFRVCDIEAVLRRLFAPVPAAS